MYALLLPRSYLMPTSLSKFFSSFKELVEISGMENLNTENVTEMQYMFNACAKLASLDLSSFNTAKVTTMSCMFDGCESLKSLDLSSFNTSNVQYMSDMFVNCTSLVTLDLSSFNTKKVTSMASMFNNCANLKTIYVSEKWNTSAVKDYKSIFNLCKKLYGGKGTHCTESDIKYAQIDGGKDNPGYLTKSGEAGFEAPLTYAKFDSETGVLTLGYSKTLPDGAKEINAEKTTSEVWIASEVTDAKNVKKIVIDKSFADFQPTRCYYWFYNCTGVTEISGLENVNTENVTDMRCMFYGNKVTMLDLRGFNTANVRDMYEMFKGCGDLKTILVSDKWTTEKVEVSGAMFRFCSKLEGMNGTKYDDETEATLGVNYAKIDGGKDNPGYFSELKAVSLEIKTAPKTEYTEGDEFIAENGVLTVKYNNNSTEDVDLSKAEITGFDNTKAGEQTLTVTYSGLSTELKVTVKENVPTPVSEIIPASGVKVWSYNGVIFIESERSGLEYKIVDLGGRTLKTSTTKSDKEEIRLNANGIVIVILGGKSYKVMAK